MQCMQKKYAKFFQLFFFRLLSPKFLTFFCYSNQLTNWRCIAGEKEDFNFFMITCRAWHIKTYITHFAGKPEGSGYMADGHQARLMEFNQFEREFEHCISQSATRTKFEQHCHRATKIIDSLYNKAQYLHVSVYKII